MVRNRHVAERGPAVRVTSVQRSLMWTWDVVEVLMAARTRLATPGVPDVSEDLKQPGWRAEVCRKMDANAGVWSKLAAQGQEPGQGEGGTRAGLCTPKTR